MEQKPEDCDERKPKSARVKKFLYREFGEGNEAMRCNWNTCKQQRGEEAMKIGLGSRKPGENIGKQLKHSGNPEERKGGWNGIAKDSPKEWRFTPQGKGVWNALQACYFARSIPSE